MQIKFYQIFNPSKILHIGVEIASSISLTRMYSSAVCEQEDFPGPILQKGRALMPDRITWWTEWYFPSSMARFYKRMIRRMLEELRRNRACFGLTLYMLADFGEQLLVK